MKPFDLELAKQGHPVCTRDGREVKILEFDFPNYSYPIAGRVSLLNEWDFYIWRDNGTHDHTHTSSYDLFMKEAEKKKEKRCLIYEVRPKTSAERSFNAMHLQGDDHPLYENVIGVVRGDLEYGRKYVSQQKTEDKKYYQIIEFEIEV